MVVKTDFDNILEDDVVFEETDETLEYSDILKNSENLMKSFLYMKKMFNSTPLLSEVIHIETVEYSQNTEYTPKANSNMIMIKNVSDVNSSMYLNGGELVLLAFESFEFPLQDGQTIELKGNLSIVETKFTIG